MSRHMLIEQEIARLADLSRSDLVERWQRIYRTFPPKGIKRGLLERAIAWHMQERRFGGLPPAIKRQLDRSIAGNAANAPDLKLGPVANSSKNPAHKSEGSEASSPATSSLPLTLAPGTRLMREWNGRMYVVDVAEGGFVFDGKEYRSLTAIAKRITGTNWSGPRFFGIVKQ